MPHGIRRSAGRLRRRITSPAVMFTVAVSTALTAAGVAPFADAALRARDAAPVEVGVVDVEDFPLAVAAGALD